MSVVDLTGLTDSESESRSGVGAEADDDEEVAAAQDWWEEERRRALAATDWDDAEEEKNRGRRVHEETTRQHCSRSRSRDRDRDRDHEEMTRQHSRSRDRDRGHGRERDGDRGRGRSRREPTGPSQRKLKEQRGKQVYASEQQRRRQEEQLLREQGRQRREPDLARLIKEQAEHRNNAQTYDLFFQRTNSGKPANFGLIIVVNGSDTLKEVCDWFLKKDGVRGATARARYEAWFISPAGDRQKIDVRVTTSEQLQPLNNKFPIRLQMALRSPDSNSNTTSSTTTSHDLPCSPRAAPAPESACRRLY